MKYTLDTKNDMNFFILYREDGNKFLQITKASNKVENVIDYLTDLIGKDNLIIN